ncbi:MAG: J domain-containing protein [Pyrinomonadaceae bacterium]
MLDDLQRCYEVLGVAPQASAQELKAAYRDLAKVWHPDRFTHDPRLQQKAQEKLKEINEAYAQLTSGATMRRARAPHTSSAPPQSAAPASAPTTSHDHLDVRRTQRQPILLPALVFLIVLCAGTTALWMRHKANLPMADKPTPAQTQVGTDEQATAVDEAGTASTVRQPKKRPAQASQTASAPAPPSDPAARARNTEALRPMPTVTLLIDPTTNMIATAACPHKLRMTYASGTEPQQLCTAHQSAGAPPPAKDSRLKSLAHRLAAPAQWLRGKDKADGIPPAAPQN